MVSLRPVAKNGLHSLHLEKTQTWGQQFEALGGRKDGDLASKMSMLPVIQKRGTPGSVPGLDGSLTVFLEAFPSERSPWN